MITSAKGRGLIRNIETRGPEKESLPKSARGFLKDKRPYVVVFLKVPHMGIYEIIKCDVEDWAFFYSNGS